jgi:hypothetical protein
MRLLRWYMWPLTLKARTPAQQRRDRVIAVALVGVTIAAFGAWLVSGLDRSPSKAWFHVFGYAAGFTVVWVLARVGAPALWASPVYPRLRRFGFPLVGVAAGLHVAYGRHGHNGLGLKWGVVVGVAFAAFAGYCVWRSPNGPAYSPRRDTSVGPVVHLRLSPDELASRLGIRLENGFASFDVAGVGPVTVAAEAGAVELYLPSDTNVTLEQLAQGLGLPPADLV